MISGRSHHHFRGRLRDSGIFGRRRRGHARESEYSQRRRGRSQWRRVDRGHGNNVVRIVVPSGIISTFAGNHIMGGGYTGDGGLATNAQLDAPTAIAVRYGGKYLRDRFGQQPGAQDQRRAAMHDDE